MHVQGMFVAEEFGSSRAPLSDESRNNSGRKLKWDSLVCTSIKYVFSAKLLSYLRNYVQCYNLLCEQKFGIREWFLKYCILMFNVRCLFCLTVLSWKWSDCNRWHIITWLTWTRFRSVGCWQFVETVICPEVSDENTSVSYVTAIAGSFAVVLLCRCKCRYSKSCWVEYFSALLEEKCVALKRSHVLKRKDGCMLISKAMNYYYYLGKGLLTSPSSPEHIILFSEHRHLVVIRHQFQFNERNMHSRQLYFSCWRWKLKTWKP